MKDDSEDSGDDRWYGKGKGKGKKGKGKYSLDEEEDSDDSDDDLPYARKAAAYKKAKGKCKGKKGKGKGPAEESSSDVESATEKPKAGEAGTVSAALEGPDVGGSSASDEGSSEDVNRRMMLCRRAGFDWNREAKDAELDKQDDKQARYDLKRKNREERKAKKYELRVFIAEEDKRRRKVGLEPMTEQEIEDLEPKKKEKRLAREAKAKEKEDKLAARELKAKGKGWYGGWDAWSGSPWSGGGWQGSSWAAASSSVDWKEAVKPPPKRPRVEENVPDPTSVPEWAKAQTRLFGDLPPLPEKWIRIRSKSTKMVYFYHLDSGASSFEMPSS